MAWNSIIPQAADLLSQSQAQILGNFTALDSMITPNATAPNGGTFKFPYNGGATPGTIASTLQMYVKNGTLGAPQIFIERETGSADAPLTYNWTEKGITTNNPAGFNGGWTCLPSGIMMLWGLTPVTTLSLFTLIYATHVPGFPGFADVPFNIQITAIPTVVPLYTYVVNTTTVTRFQCKVSNGTSNPWGFYYLIMGLANAS